MNWSLADVEKASKPKGAAQVQRKPPEPIPVPPGENEAIIAPEIPLSELRTLPAPTSGTYPGPCHWILGYGRATLRLAKPFEPDRLRLVLAFGPDEVLLAALIATAEAHFATLKS